MIARLRRAARGEQGFTLVEMGVATFLSTLVLGAVVLVVNAVGQNASDARQRADLQVQAREVVTEMAAELRAAEAPQITMSAIASLAESALTFYSDRYDFPGPEKIVYERTACAGEYCQLRVRRYAADPASAPNWVYLTLPFNDVVLLERVAATPAMFAGSKWAGSPLERTTVPSCGGATACNFPIVTIVLRAAPPGVSTIEGPFELLVEVNLRNA